MYAEPYRMKLCKYCGEERAADDFVVDKRSPSGFRGKCKPCRRAFRRQPKEREKEVAYNRQYRERNSEYFREYERRRSLDKQFGLTLEQYDAMKLSQDNKCAICRVDGKNASQRYKNLCVDHNHETGAIRGLLCDNCNRAIGLFGDSIELLESAIGYLKRYGSVG